MKLCLKIIASSHCCVYRVNGTGHFVDFVELCPYVNVKLSDHLLIFKRCILQVYLFTSAFGRVAVHTFSAVHCYMSVC